MILTGLVFAFVAAKQSPTPWKEALKEADAELHQVLPYPQCAPDFRHVEDDYRNVLDEADNVPTAHAGLAKCLAEEGKYSEAAREFALSGLNHSQDEALARKCDAFLKSLKPRLGPYLVVQAQPIPNTLRFAVLIGLHPKVDDGSNRQIYSDLKLLLVRSSHGKAIEIVDRRRLRESRYRMQTPDPSGYGPKDQSTANLYVFKRTWNGHSWSAVVIRNHGPADCEPVAVQVCPLGSSSIEGCDLFGSLNNAAVYPPTQRHGMTVKVGPGWKVSWFDAYEWRDGRFTFANRVHPEFNDTTPRFPRDFESDHHYPDWMIRAAINDVHGRWLLALGEWKRAERACLKTLHTEDDPNSEYRVAEFYGVSSVILREIRKRIHWIQRRQFSHFLLYRPYDFDLQVPPYRLGNSWEASD